ncbi:MAG: BLUF domain-containing protein [Anaerolineae bacterium]|nr:BLUF domain-containing protein [Anaerolineae bacterium]
MELVSMVYVSVATKPMSDDELRALLEVCRDKNQKIDVTGMLLYRDRFFIQALEGENKVVETLFDKIRQDPRHRNVMKVYKSIVKQRSFGNWSMGFNKLEDVAPDTLDGYTDFLARPQANYFVDKPNRAVILLESFKERMYF